VQAELASRLAALGPLPGKGASGKSLNEHGVLYGRYGLLPDAERCFKAAANIPYAPAVVNLGNVAFLKGDAETAYRCYKQAQLASPKDPKILANLAKAQAALGKSDEVGQTLAALAKVDPAAASRYSSLAQGGSGSVRATEAGDDSVAWLGAETK
jgi:Flp pilus assembly protein TadD